jgi:hypothetical protein
MREFDILAAVDYIKEKYGLEEETYRALVKILDYAIMGIELENEEHLIGIITAAKSLVNPEEMEQFFIED